MPAKSKKQLKLIFAIRNKYKNKLKTPEKWKWVWDEEWSHLETPKILEFNEFNEFKDDEIDELCVYYGID